MDRYKALLVNLLQNIDQKLNKITDLLEVSKDAEDGGDDCVDANQK